MSRPNNQVHIDDINESVIEKKSLIFIVSCLFRIKQVCIIVMNEWNFIEVASTDRLPFRTRPVVANIASTFTDAADMDKDTVLQVSWA